ncbi:TonB-dependent receptor [Sphingomonas sp. RHCKR47]|uniref:TonB-dependent receptor n=1 Tax=Sphingomonas citricola TaxID=2862498 RepID=UPI001CA4E170|nr:TonB-dependent receptor [Sphingomonas citricola]MBW6522675.1 TonB-dependent receptor [Sphingomonas citricola]
MKTTMLSLLGSCALTALTPGFASAQAGPPAPAQDAATSADTATPTPTAQQNAGGEIIVTANRREEALSRVGIPVSVVTSDQLQSQEIRQTFDLARVVPGFQATTAGLSGSPVYILRGVGFDTPNPSSTAPVGTYVDEVAYAYPYMSLGANFDLERVEVLKGPQGTLYGRNSTGGLVDFITAKPTATAQGGFTLGYGNYDSFLAEGFVSGPVSSTLKARLAFQSENRAKGWQYSVTRPNDRLGQRYRQSVRGTVQWDPTDRFSVTASGTYWELRGEPQAPQAIAYVGNPALQNPLLTASLIPNPSNNRQADWTPIGRQPRRDITGIIRPFYDLNSKFAAGMVKANLELSDTVSLSSLTSYNRLSFNTVSEANGVQTESQTATSTGLIKSFAQELRFLGDTGALNWSVGGYYARDTTHEFVSGFVDELSTIVGLRAAAAGINTRLGNPVNPTALATSFRNYSGVGDYTNRVLAGFANVEYRFGDLFKLSAGGRYTEDRLRGSGCGRDVNGNNVTLVNFLYPILTRNPGLQGITRGGCYTLTADNSRFALAEQGQKQHNFSWRVRGDFTPSDTVLLYGSISRGYKAGAFPVLAASNASQLLPVTQEKLTAYEAGVKLNLLDRRVQLNATGYYYDYINRQVFGRIPDLIFGTLQRIVNIPKSEVYGAELDVTARLTQTLRVQASGSYLHAEVKEYTGFNNQVAAARVDYAGARLPYSPKFQANGSIINDMPVGNDLMLFTSVFGSYQSRSSSVLGDEAGFGIKAYGLLGAKVGIHAADDSWGVEGYVSNLTNTYYWTSAQRQSETLVRYAGMPRMYGARATFRF